MMLSSSTELTDITHELRTPIAGILGMIDMLIVHIVLTTAPQ